MYREHIKGAADKVKGVVKDTAGKVMRRQRGAPTAIPAPTEDKR